MTSLNIEYCAEIFLILLSTMTVKYIYTKNKIWKARFIVTKQLLVSKNQNQISIMMFLSSITILVWPKCTDIDLDLLSEVAKHLFSFRSVYLCMCLLTKRIWLQEEQRYDPSPNTNPSIDFAGSWICTLVRNVQKRASRVKLSVLNPALI